MYQYEFETDKVICDYISPVGNSDVPYPVAYGIDNVYFMLDREYIAKENLVYKTTIMNAERIYDEYYRYSDSNGKVKSKNEFKNIEVLVPQPD